MASSVGRVCAEQEAVAGQRPSGPGSSFATACFHQPQSVILLDPGVEFWVEPDGLHQTLILEAQDPGRMTRGQANQAIARTFFRAYFGIGAGDPLLGPASQRTTQA